jgi:hypothetical protein|tara:strand:- start:283 stop:492 length:210 start_codon:yes stop_codon:yes gene_type:complete
MKDRNIVALVTFAIFSTEAYAHYLVAKNEDNDEFKFYIPKLETTLKNLLVVGAFSILNGIAVEKVKNIL